MAWGFTIDCPDCNLQWDGILVSLTLGPRSRNPDSSQEWCCPDCCCSLHLPRSVDRKTWQVWYERFLDNPFPRTKTARFLLARIDAGFADARWYVPREIELDRVDCLLCSSPMILLETSAAIVTCPACGSKKPEIAGFHSHCSMAVGENGFR